MTTLMEIYSARSDLFFGVSDFSQAQAEADELLSLARRTGDRTIEAGALVQGALARAWREDFPEAVVRATEAIEVSEARRSATCPRRCPVRHWLRECPDGAARKGRRRDGSGVEYQSIRARLQQAGNRPFFHWGLEGVARKIPRECSAGYRRRSVGSRATISRPVDPVPLDPGYRIYGAGRLRGCLGRSAGRPVAGREAR